MKTKAVKVNIPIYFGFLRIVVTQNFNDTAKHLNVDDEGLDLNTFGAFSCLCRGPHHEPIFTVFFDPDVDHDLIAHEVVHLVNLIYIERHIELDMKNDEHQALLAGWVTGQIYEVLEK